MIVNHDEAFLLASMTHKESNLARCYLSLRSDPEGVAARELAEWMIRNSLATGHGDTFHDMLQELEWQIEELRRHAQARGWRVNQVSPASDATKSRE